MSRDEKEKFSDQMSVLSWKLRDGYVTDEKAVDEVLLLAYRMLMAMGLNDAAVAVCDVTDIVMEACDGRS